VDYKVSMYNVTILINKAAELGWLPIDVFEQIQKLPADERISSCSVYRVFELRRGRPDTLRVIAKVLGFELKDIVIREQVSTLTIEEKTV
jgi:hypothetical protein